MAGWRDVYHMMKDPQQVLTKVFGDAIQDTGDSFGETTLVVAADKIVEICQTLRDDRGLAYNYLSGVTALDYYPVEPRFGVCYHLLSMRYNRRLRLKVMWSDGDSPIPSVTGVWPSANWHEREVFDMFGVIFDGHPDLRRILMPSDWDGHPLRKDYPLGYETVQFSFNFDDVNKHKPYAKK